MDLRTGKTDETKAAALEAGVPESDITELTRADALQIPAGATAAAVEMTERLRKPQQNPAHVHTLHVENPHQPNGVEQIPAGCRCAICWSGE